MAIPRESLDTDSIGVDHDGPTPFRTDRNAFEVPCSVCGGIFFVDEPTFDRVEVAAAYDGAAHPFLCADCEAEYAEDAYDH